MHYKKYNWFHIPTGEGGTREFTEAQATESGADLSPMGIPALQALALVNSWNASSKDWKYWL